MYGNVPPTVFKCFICEDPYTPDQRITLATPKNYSNFLNMQKQWQCLSFMRYHMGRKMICTTSLLRSPISQLRHLRQRKSLQRWREYALAISSLHSRLKSTKIIPQKLKRNLKCETIWLRINWRQGYWGKGTASRGWLGHWSHRTLGRDQHLGIRRYTVPSYSKYLPQNTNCGRDQPWA